MALTITQEGYGILANCDGLTDSAGGTWTATGVNTISNTVDTYLYGTSSIACALSNKSAYILIDKGAGNELDFGVAGTEEGQHIYFWIQCPTIGLLETVANKGLTIRIGTTTGDYREWLIAGSDDANGWNGAWKCFVLDPTKTGSVTDTGTYDITSLRHFGVWMDTAATAKGDNIFIDQISVAHGLRVIGTSTTGWLDIVNYCTDYPNRAWGMFQEREGIYYSYGKTWIGDSTQTAAVSFVDSGRVIQYGESEYWDGTSLWVTSADIDYSGIIIEDASTFSTTFTDGVLVGTDNGRSGSTIIGHPNHNVSLDLYAGNEATSVTTLYGTTFSDITGTINFGNDIDHKIYGVSFNGCAQVDPVGAPVIRNCTFAETVATDASLLWNDNIDIVDCNFIANTTGAAIEHPASTGTPYSYDALSFDGNTNDVNNTSGASIVVQNTNGSDASTYTGTLVTFESPVTITFTGIPTGTNARLYLGTANNSTASTLEAREDNILDGDFVVNTNSGGSNAYAVFIPPAGGEAYKLLEFTPLPSVNSTIPVSFAPDRVYST